MEKDRAQAAIAGLRLAMHMESAIHAPHTTDTLEAMREAVETIKYLQALCEAFETMKYLQARLPGD
jgi:hypothetical protein